MNRITKLSIWFLGAAVALVAFSGSVKAATTQNVDVNVSISGSKSVIVTGNTYYSFGALSVDVSSVSATALTITNNSTVFIETYTITGANAISNGGGTNWTLDTSTAADQYALAALFGTARPTDVDGSWANDDLTTSPSTCSETDHGNGTEAQGGSNVSPSGARSLWFRIKTPSSVTDAGEHTATLTVSVL